MEDTVVAEEGDMVAMGGMKGDGTMADGMAIGAGMVMGGTIIIIIMESLITEEATGVGVGIGQDITDIMDRVIIPTIQTTIILILLTLRVMFTPLIRTRATIIKMIILCLPENIRPLVEMAKF
jgi:hypothetical protein